MRKALVVGGNSGIGLSICKNLLGNYDQLYIVGKGTLCTQALPNELKKEFEKKSTFFELNFVNDDFTIFDQITDVDTLIITAGFGRVALFEDLTDAEVKNLMTVDFTSIVRIVKKYYHMIKGDRPFYTAIMGSIAGHVSSPYFSIYGAAKSGLCRFIENVNIELKAAGIKNRILDVSPGSLKGTAFNGDENKLSLVDDVAVEVIKRMYAQETLYVPQFEETYKDVVKRYQADAVKFGDDSYRYKAESGRVSNKPQVVIGYLSGTFDLFHIGHLKLLQRAKEQCDYLVVGVHFSGTWKGKETFVPFEERCEIVRNIKYVDRVIQSTPEDSDAWEILHYHKLFVGSDYKGTERFKRYEEVLKGKADIVYFPYTQGTSSTQLRAAISKKQNS